MNEKICIAILGAPTNNGNLGCLALTYSLLNMLNSIAKEKKYKFEYHVFEMNPDKKAAERIANEIGLSTNSILTHNIAFCNDFFRFCKHITNNISFIHDIKKCRLAIDLTQGDSFTDIYGQYRFLVYTRMKILIEKLGIPMIFGPQTYGPFKTKANEQIAKKSIISANLVIARDKASAECVNKISGINPLISTDLALGLPYNNQVIESNQKSIINVGVNISALLIKDKAEGTRKDFSIKTDYDGYIDGILTFLQKNEKYKVYLIPHVVEDCSAIASFEKKYKGFISVDMFNSPIVAKEFISKMDVFIGARMHATIAAFSSGVATIPVAYSRKFAGLYNSIGYNYIIDLMNDNTDEAINKTIQFINEREYLKGELKNSNQIATKKLEELKMILMKEIASILSKK